MTFSPRNQASIFPICFLYFIAKLKVYFSNNHFSKIFSFQLKMRSVIIVLVVCVVAALAQQEYTNKYDNVSIETVLSNDRVLSNYIKCLLEKGACTREGRELKRKYNPK